MSTLQLISSTSRLLPSIVALVLISRLDISFKIFTIILWLGVINELLSAIFIYKLSISPMYNINIYVFIESILLLLFFKAQNVFKANNKLFYYLITLFIVSWFIEMFLVYDLSIFSEFFITFYSFVIALVAIKNINYIIKNEQILLLRNPSFIISIGLVIFYTYATFVQVYFLKALHIETNLKYKIYDILIYVNIISNLIFAGGLLIIKKQKPVLFSTGLVTF